MAAAKDCTSTSNKRSGSRPIASGRLIDFKKSYRIDTIPVTGSGYLRDHRVGGKIMYPAAGFSMAGIAVHEALSGSGNKQEAFSLENLKFRHTLTLSEKNSTDLRLSYRPDRSEFSVYGSTDGDTGQEQQLAVGTIAAANSKHSVAEIEINKLVTRFSDVVDVGEFYGRLGRSGLEYGPFFRGITEARTYQGSDESITKLSSHPCLHIFEDPWAQAVTLLDSAFQSLAVTLNIGEEHLYMPSRIRALKVSGKFEPDLWCYTRLVKSTNRAVVGDITLFNSRGKPIVEIDGLLCMKIPKVENQYRNDRSVWSKRASSCKCVLPRQHPSALSRGR